MVTWLNNMLGNFVFLKRRKKFKNFCVFVMHSNKVFLNRNQFSFKFSEIYDFFMLECFKALSFTSTLFLKHSFLQAPTNEN